MANQTIVPPLDDKKAKLPGELRPAPIDIRSIDGFDPTTKRIQRDPRFRNLKSKLRGGVMKSLAEVTDFKQKPPVEVWIEKGGKIHLIDGDHRVADNIKRLAEAGFPTESPWWNIRAFKGDYDEHGAIIRSMTANDPFTRGNLDDSEVVALVDRCLNELAMDKEAIVAEIGRGSKRFITRIEAILNASPEVREAAIKGEIDIETGSQIIEQTPFAEQGDAVTAVVEALEEAMAEDGAQEPTAEHHKKARESTGLQGKRRLTLKLKQIEALLWPFYEDYRRMMGGTLAKDETTMTWCGALVRCLGMVPPDGEYQPTDGAPLTWDEIEAVLDPAFDAFVEKRDNPNRRPNAQGQKRPRKKRQD